MTFPRKILSTLSCLSICIIVNLLLSSKVEAQNHVDMVADTVQIFYQKYLQAAREHVVSDLQQQEELHPQFIQKIADLLHQAENNEQGFLEFDPILLAQDIPEGIEIGQVILTGSDKAHVLVYILWTGVKTTLKVSLFWENKTWSIIEIESADGDN